MYNFFDVCFGDEFGQVVVVGVFQGLGLFMQFWDNVRQFQDIENGGFVGLFGLVCSGGFCSYSFQEGIIGGKCEELSVKFGCWVGVNFNGYFCFGGGFGGMGVIFGVYFFQYVQVCQYFSGFFLFYQDFYFIDDYCFLVNCIVVIYRYFGQCFLNGFEQLFCFCFDGGVVEFVFRFLVVFQFFVEFFLCFGFEVFEFYQVVFVDCVEEFVYGFYVQFFLDCYDFFGLEVFDVEYFLNVFWCFGFVFFQGSYLFGI